MQTSLQSFKSSQKVNILDGKQEKKKRKIKNCGQCDCGPSKPEETTPFVCNKKKMGFAPSKLTVNKNEESIFCASEN